MPPRWPTALGFDETRLSEYVAGKTSEGIFTDVGREETQLRIGPIGPIGAGKSLLKGMQGLSSEQVRARAETRR